MTVPTIQNGRTQFFPILYEGNGGGQRVGKFVPFTDNGTIANSCVFDDGSNEYLNRTPGSASNRRTFTFSCWIKLGAGTIDSGAEKAIFSARDGSSDNYSILSINGDQSGANQLEFINRTASGYAGYAYTTRTLEDSSKWYHVMVAVDTTDDEPNDRIKLYIDGDRATVTYSDPGEDTDMAVNNNVAHAIGARPTNNFHWDGYIAEANFVDGSALTPDTFGVTDTSTGRWVPKTLSGITYGTNGFRLQFGTSSAMGDDTSGNDPGNDFSLNSIDAANQTTDSPTQNHATMNPSNKASTNASLSEGNLTVTQSNTYGGACAGMALPSSGKYYWEIKSVGTMDGNTIVGIVPDNGVTIAGSGQFPGGSSNSGSFGFAPAQTSDAQTVRNSVFENCPTLSKTTTAGTYIQMCWDGNTGSLWFGLNDTFEGNPSAGTGASFTGINNTIKLFPACFAYADVFEFNFGQRSFQYTPPTGFVALQQDNLPETAKGITGFTWIKDRDNALNHNSYDSSNGVFNRLVPNATSTILNTQGGVSKFLKGGIVVGDTSNVNNSGASMVSWNWVANGGTTASNGDGSITSTVQVNSTAGFSIIRFTGTNSAATVGHGLSVAPEWVISKNLDATASWAVYHKDLSSYAKTLFLNTTAAETSTSTMWDSKATTADVINVSSNFATNGSSNRMVMYAWHSVDGFSKFGKYTGNGSSNGSFVYTGFRPAWLMIKRTNSAANWYIIDTERDPINPTGQHNINADTTSTESSNAGLASLDILSNGFKNRQGAGTGINDSGSTYIYMAFAENPFIGSQTLKGFSPVTAR